MEAGRGDELSMRKENKRRNRGDRGREGMVRGDKGEDCGRERRGREVATAVGAAWEAAANACFLSTNPLMLDT